MKYCCDVAGRTAALWFLLFFSILTGPRALAQSSNGVLREVYTGIAGNAVSDLTSSPNYPCCPNLETIQPTFEAPTEFAENYGQRMRALVVAPQSGNYTFWVASDDGGALFLSTTENPAQRVQIATVNAWTSSREWTKEANQQSAAIPLVAGQRYYIEALQKEGGGGDNLAVRWRLPSGVIEEPIPNNRLLVYGVAAPIVSLQPTNVTVVEGNLATFNVQLQRMIGAVFQWKRNGTNIPNATNAVYTLGPLALADTASSFFCSITNSLGGTNSNAAMLTVVPDTTKPTINTVGNLGDNNILFVVFSEPVEISSAAEPSNYTVNGGVTVMDAAFGVDARTIILTTSPMAPNVTYTLTVNNVRDRATTPNTIVPNTQRTFSVTTRPIDIGLLSLPKEPLGPTTRRHGVVISEVMYHPTNRFDGRNLEFIEIYNAQPWFEELGGWRISGAIDYRFPTNFVLASRSFVVVAANPADFRAVYSYTNVLGPFLGSNGLQNSSGTLRLRNERDAVVFEMNYSGDPPFPVAADGAGHSLVLARASYGERDPRAWLASDQTGGTPGAGDIFNVNALRTVVINEFLAHTDPPDVDYIELFNYGNSTVNVGGCILTDDPATNKFLVPANTSLPPRGFLVFTEAQLGFSLSSSGETLLLKHPSGRTVIDGIRFGPQENGVATGRFPDGAATFTRLAAPTPGTNNAPFKEARVVINEIMYGPITDNPDDEYIELYNRSTNVVNVGGWRIRDAVTFNIPTNTVIAAGGYLVIAHHAAHLRTNYSGLTVANTVGDYGGTLANGGEHIELTMPDDQVSTNAAGQLRTNVIHIVVDEVTYGPGGRWGGFAHGGGSSLELRDARADRRLAPNWADSDESAKSPWVTVEATGTMDNGYADANQLHITLLGAGEALVDNVEVIPAGGANVIANGTFESGVTGWVFQGNHNQTGWETSQGFGSQRSLHLRAAGRGDTGANRVRTQLPSTLSPNTVVTLRARVRWLKGCPNILLRLRGNWMEAPGYILTARNLGTPGAVNSRAAANIGPAITDVLHWPPLPAASQQVLVTARVQDPDGLSYLALNYRIDPGTNYLALAMTNNGAGVFSAVLPAQAAGARAAFFIQAADHFSPPASSTFPREAPLREGLVQWGDTTIPGTLPTFRMWVSQTNVARWASEEKMSNNPKDMTFVYGTNRIIYNAGAWFHGSPYHSPSYDSPVGASCDYDLGFPEDDRLLGETDINLFRPGNGGGDGTGQAEIHGYWFGRQFGVPYLYHRPVFVFVNGQRRETIFHDAQQPNGDFVEQWFPDDTEGDLHKIQIGFEFGDLAYGASEPGFGGAGANLANYTTTGGVKKQARYRQTWPRRSATPLELNDYTNIFVLVNTTLTNAAINSATYTSALTNSVDVEEWFKVHVTQHLFVNNDSYSYGGGQNAFAYKPERDTWKLFLWDIDFAFGGSATDANLTTIGGADHGPRNDHAPFRRIYWQALIEAANGMLSPTRSNPILDARYNGMVAGGAGVGSAQGIKDFIASRRSLILSQIAANQSTFAITANGGADFSTNRNVVVLTGTAPLEVRTLLVNGVVYPTTWTAFNTWQIRVPLVSGTNSIQITGMDPRGALVAGVAGTIRVNYTGATESPRGRLAINEIMYNPIVPGASFIEIYNSSSTSSFDLSRWRLEGVDFTFADGTLIGPGAYVVLARDAAAYGLAYGSLAPVIATFAGTLRNEGETLKLIKPGATADLDEIVDQVSYEASAPWPAAANGLGPSLQLIDATQDHARAANWGAALSGSRFTPGAANSVRTTLTPFPQVWLNEVMPDDAFASTNNILDGFGDRDPWVELYNGSTNAISLAGWSLANNYTNLAQWPFPTNAVIGPQQFVLVWLDGEPGESTPTEWHANFRAAPAVGAIALARGANALVDHLNYNLPTSSRSYGDFPEGNASGRRVFSIVTPGATNKPAGLPITIFINEWMADNFSTLADPADGNSEDWFELFNPGSATVDLTGYFLTDELTNRFKYAIPAGTLVQGGGHLLVWADGETSQTGPYPQEIHANFSLAKFGEAIGLFAPDGTLIDAVSFGPQTTDVSQGRFPDGAATILNFTNATPREPNALVSQNDPPTLNPIGNQNANEGSVLTFTATATDPNAGQTLTYSFVGPAPFGATLNPSSGIFQWQPGEAQGPGKFVVTIRVTDNAVPPLSDEETFFIFISEVNSAPQLSFPTDWTVAPDAPFSIDASGIDEDLPMQSLAYALEPGAPAGASIDPVTGQFSWTPRAADVGTNQFTVRVTDNGVPPASASRPLNIVVLSGLRAEISQDGAQVLIGFATTPGRTYRVFYRENLAEGGWMQLGADTLADGTRLTVPDNVALGAQRFYRVEKVD